MAPHTDLIAEQIEWCRARIRGFASAHDQAENARKSTADYHALHDGGLDLARARRKRVWMRERHNIALAAPIRWKWGSP